MVVTVCFTHSIHDGSLKQSMAYLSRLVFFLLYGDTILNMISTTPFLPKEIAFTALKEQYINKYQTKLEIEREDAGKICNCRV